MNSNTHVQPLNKLLETCLDGELGYRTAARHLHNSKLRMIFTDYAIRRGQFAEELRSEVELLGGTPVDAGSIAASLHRGWISLKSAVTHGDTGAIVAACEAGEDSALASYKAAMQLDFPGHIRSLIEQQRQSIEQAHARIQQIRNEIDSGSYHSEND
jgi:uncharacterized protein (TIGR02284 family)